MSAEKDVKSYYLLVRKILRSEILSKREASHFSIIFADWAIDRLPKGSDMPDILYDRLLTLI